MSIETDGLRLFILAAELLNISAAGRKLGMAPAVSSAKLAKLETTIGAELLHRTTRKVSLSIEGADFLPFAKEIIAQEEAAMAALGKGATKASGTLRFTAPSTFAQMYIAPIVPKFIDQFPDVGLEMHLSDAQFDLIEGSYDLALRYSPLVETSLKGRKLADDKRILCASPAYLEKNGIPETPADLDEHKLIAFRHLTPRPLKSMQGDEAMFGYNLENSPLVVDDGLSQKHATLAGAGISMNAVWSVHDELRAGTLKRVLPDYEAAEESMLWMIYPKSNVLSPKVRVFMDFLTAEIGKKPPWASALQ